MKPFAIGRNVLFLVLLALVFTIASSCATAAPTPPLAAPPSDIAWLIGTWMWNQQALIGAYTALYPAKVTIEFKYHEGGDIRWELTVALQSGLGVYGRHSQAEGSATVSDDKVALKGRYVSGSRKNLSYDLTRNGDILEGTGIGATGALQVSSGTKIR